MLTEIGKLDAVRAVGLAEGVFSGIAPKVVAAWRAFPHAAASRSASQGRTSG
jgi:hypothetical protein